MDDDISNEVDELVDEVMNDPEIQRERQREKEEWERQRLDIESRPDAPTDGELLSLINKGFALFCETPFGNDYDHLIERLSFTDRTLESEDAGKLKTAWTRFLNEVDIAFGWPLNEGMAGWYEEREMYAHAIAVYEHLYTLVRRGALEHGDFDQRSDSSERSFLETWLTNLVKLYSRQKQPERARHLGELIENYYIDGYVSLAGYIEIISVLPELSRTAIARQACSDRDEAWNRLKYEHALLFEDLHDRTKEFLVEAELWSNNHWININPCTAPLCWAKAMESEFHYKVFEPNRSQLQEFLGKDAPRDGQGCTLGQIAKLMKDIGYGSNVDLKYILATMCNSEFLTSQDTLDKLNVVRVDRNRVAHGSKKETYTLENGHDFLRKIRETNWVFDFLDALQPKNRSGRN